VNVFSPLAGLLLSLPFVDGDFPDRFADADSVSAPDPALLDIDMHDLWHTYWHGAVNTDPDGPKLERLALPIIQSREQGMLAVATTDSSNLGVASAVATPSEGDRI